MNNDVLLYQRDEDTGRLHKIGVLVGSAEFALTHKQYLEALVSQYDEVRVQTIDDKGEMVYNKENPDGFFSEYAFDGVYFY